MIKVYSTGCPKCKILLKKLDSAAIEYEICNDTEEMSNKGITYLPVVEKDGKIYNFGEANKLINENKL